MLRTNKVDSLAQDVFSPEEIESSEFTLPDGLTHEGSLILAVGQAAGTSDESCIWLVATSAAAEKGADGDAAAAAERDQPRTRPETSAEAEREAAAMWSVKGEDREGERALYT